MFRVIRGVLKSRQAIESEKYDILYFHGIPLSFPFFNSKSVVVNHIHGMTNPFLMSGRRIVNNRLVASLYEKYRSLVIDRSDLILLAADEVGYQKFLSLFPLNRAKIRYMPNFADESIFYPIDKQLVRKELGIGCQGHCFVTTGRVSYQKDPILLVESFAYYLNVLGYTADLFVIGDGELMENAKIVARKNNIEDRVQFLGKLSRNEITKWLNASDLFVYTSHANGFPISLVEASLCFLPMVSTDVTGVHDLIIEGETGNLVSERRPEKIAEAISLALMNAPMYSENIKQIANSFRLDKAIIRLENSLSDAQSLRKAR
jgi:glycosyltransferase involved in cell wall biosynthesis